MEVLIEYSGHINDVMHSDHIVDYIDVMVQST